MAVVHRAPRKEQSIVDVYGGPAAPLERDYEGLCEDVIIGAVENLQSIEAAFRRNTQAAKKIQAFSRGWIARKRYQRHQKQLKGDLNVLMTARRMRCAILLQRFVRGLIHRLHYKKVRAEEEGKRKEAEEKKKKPAAKSKKGDATPSTAASSELPKSLAEAALQRNLAFVNGFKSYIVGNLAEAISYFEQQKKSKSEPIVDRMIVICRTKKEGIPRAAPGGGNAGASGVAAPSGSGGPKAAGGKAPAAPAAGKAPPAVKGKK